MEYFWKDVINQLIPGEIWMRINNHPAFEISSLGRIREKGIFRKYGRTNKGGKDNGYLFTGIKGRKLIHRLVAIHFVDNPHPDIYDQVNHLDGDKANPVALNLEWCNNKLNAIHAVKTGLYTPMMCDKNGAATMCNGKAMSIIRTMATSSLTNREAAQYFNVPYSTLRKIKDGNHCIGLDVYRNKFQ